MTLSYGFYNSSGGDRVYDALQMSSIFDGIIEDGVFATIGDKFATTENTGMQVFVGTGRAWFDHTWSYNDAPVSLVIPAADPLLPRMDVVYLEVNETTRTNSFGVLQGTPASVPTQPALTNTATVHQYRLARITVPAGATSIVQGDIQNTVGWAATPWVTGPLTVLDNEDQVAAWESQFMTWFDEMKDQLSVDAAGNLQIQIDAIEADIDSKFPVDTINLANDAVSNIKLADNAVTESKIAPYAVTYTKILGTLAGDGLLMNAGSPMSVRVDNSTIAIISDVLRVKDGGITPVKIANRTRTYWLPITSMYVYNAPMQLESWGAYINFSTNDLDAALGSIETPADFDSGNLTIQLLWYNDGGPVRISFGYKVYQAGSNPTGGSAAAWTLQNTYVMDFTTLINVPVVSGDILSFRLGRDVNHADDTNSGSVKIYGVKMSYTADS